MTGGFHSEDAFGHAVKNNSLSIGGRPVEDIVKEVGQTPLYIYDSTLIERRIEHLRRALPEQVKIHYAVKANPNVDVVQCVSKLVDGLDVASQGELGIALSTATKVDDISFAGPGKGIGELKCAVESGIVINVESETELERLADIARQTGITPKVALRINPIYELKASGMKMAGGPKQFGIDEERLPGVLQDFPAEFSFEGFHIFAGSQNLQPAALIEAYEQNLRLAERLSQYAPRPPRFVNIGGGIGIPYFKGDEAVDLDALGIRLADVVSKAKLKGSEIVIELGRYIVGEAGVYLCEVVDKKVSRGKTFLITNGGLHHHLSASGNFGQVIRKNYPVLLANRISSGETTEMVDIVGPLCTPLDILASNLEVPTSEIGDLVAVMQSGAYGYTASPLLFLGHPPPQEVFL